VCKPLRIFPLYLYLKRGLPSKRTSESTHYRWLVKGGKRVFGKWRLFSGKTAIEAVAKLWLALNKNETPHHQAW
jgi:hypothetical protein